jgi:EAL domain-containing protein (putative c-di-GMP-specific phosphodiesterase class I)
MENFGALKRMGFAIVLDDFGTGYSSLRLLHRFRVDKIKIDRSFVADLGQSVEAETLVGAIVKLARSFHLGVIAEGVETEEQKDLLIAAGCHEFQGYLTGRPALIEDLGAQFGGNDAVPLRA